MGFRFRKSVRFGPFRINFNKSGIGYSVGTKGLRYTKTAKGNIRVTTSIPGTGISYVTETRGKQEKTRRKITMNNNYNNNYETEYPKINKNFEIIFFSILIFLVIFFCVCMGLAFYMVLENNSDSELNNVVQSEEINSSISYSEEELLFLENHPTVHSDVESAKEFYKNMNVETVEVLTGLEYSQKHYSLSLAEEEIMLYLIECATHKDNIGYFYINIIDQDMIESFDEYKGLELIKEYLPENYLSRYKVDRTYKVSDEKIDKYVCGMRLNDEGVEYHNTVDSKYSYFYCLYIVHNKECNRWQLYTDYSAYGGRDVGWIDNYAQEWEIDFTKYAN